jgi:hypothetical protein
MLGVKLGRNHSKNGSNVLKSFNRDNVEGAATH